MISVSNHPYTLARSLDLQPFLQLDFRDVFTKLKISPHSSLRRPCHEECIKTRPLPSGVPLREPHPNSPRQLQSSLLPLHMRLPAPNHERRGLVSVAPHDQPTRPVAPAARVFASTCSGDSIIRGSFDIAKYRTKGSSRRHRR